MISAIHYGVVVFIGVVIIALLQAAYYFFESENVRFHVAFYGGMLCLCVLKGVITYFSF